MKKSHFRKFHLEKMVSRMKGSKVGRIFPMIVVVFVIFSVSVDQEMIVPEWLFELPIIELERNEFRKLFES